MIWTKVAFESEDVKKILLFLNNLNDALTTKKKEKGIRQQMNKMNHQV